MGEKWQGERESSDQHGLRLVDKQVLFFANKELGVKATANLMNIRPWRVRQIRRRVKEVLGVPLKQDFAHAVLEARKRRII